MKDFLEVFIISASIFCLFLMGRFLYLIVKIGFRAGWKMSIVSAITLVFLVLLMVGTIQIVVFKVAGILPIGFVPESWHSVPWVVEVVSEFLRWSQQWTWARFWQK